MRIVLPVLACAAAGLALAILVWQALASHTVRPVADEMGVLPLLDSQKPNRTVEPSPFDPEVAATEIAQLRRINGTVLQGTLLEAQDESTDFGVGLVGHTSVANTVEPGSEGLLCLLRSFTKSCEQRAESCEHRQQYKQADELRSLANESRLMARRVPAIAKEDQYNWGLGRTVDR